MVATVGGNLACNFKKPTDCLFTWYMFANKKITKNRDGNLKKKIADTKIIVTGTTKYK